MNRIIIGCVIAALPGLASAGEKIKRTLEVGSAPEVHVINARGDIDVRGEGSGEVRVDAKLVDAVERLDIKEKGDVIYIEVVYKKKKRNSGWNSGGTTLYVQVPTDTTLHAKGVSSDLDIQNVRGRLYLTTVSGDIDTESWTDKLKVSTTSGDIDVVGNDVDGYNSLETVSGDIDMSGLRGELRASTVSGGIDASDCMFNSVSVGNTSGDIDLSDSLSASADVDAESVSGDISMSMQSGWAGRVDVKTLNGSIDNCFGPKPQRVSRYGPGRTLNFEHGDGSGRIQIETLNGDIDICTD